MLLIFKKLQRRFAISVPLFRRLFQKRRKNKETLIQWQAACRKGEIFYKSYFERGRDLAFQLKPSIFKALWSVWFIGESLALGCA